MQVDVALPQLVDLAVEALEGHVTPVAGCRGDGRRVHSIGDRRVGTALDVDPRLFDCFTPWRSERPLKMDPSLCLPGVRVAGNGRVFVASVCELEVRHEVDALTAVVVEQLDPHLPVVGLTSCHVDVLRWTLPALFSAGDLERVLPRMFVAGQSTLDVPAVPVGSGFEPCILQDLPRRHGNKC
eukprot:GHVL01042435.1.p2 GENE.GHVL01042435.1~~GHVL01042435.1.p2  ORF type:complete len:183 (-),score=16.93 GHVL01042435.1:54-602(-)